MAGSSFGTIFKITTWGESHGDGIGVVVDGCPAGITFDEEQVQAYLNRRKPGRSTTKHSAPPTIPRSQAITAPDTPTLLTMPNMVSATTAAAGVPRGVKRSGGWRRAHLPALS